MARIQRPHSYKIAFSEEEYAKLHVLARRKGLDVSSTMRLLVRKEYELQARIGVPSSTPTAIVVKAEQVDVPEGYAPQVKLTFDCGCEIFCSRPGGWSLEDTPAPQTYWHDPGVYGCKKAS